MYRTSTVGKYCWARFDTDLLNGVGWEGGLDSRFDFNSNIGSEFIDILVNENKRHIDSPYGLHYARANESFTFKSEKGTWTNDDWFKNVIQSCSNVQRERDTPALLIFFERDKGSKTYNREHWEKATDTLLKAGASTIKVVEITDKCFYILADASNIS
jgi:hypothetical protein